MEPFLQLLVHTTQLMLKLDLRPPILTEAIKLDKLHLEPSILPVFLFIYQHLKYI